VPQGVGADLIATLEGFTREDVDRFAVDLAAARGPAREAGYFKPARWCRCTDFLGQTILEEDEFIKPRTTVEALAGLKPSFEQLGAMGFDAVAISRYPQVERITMCTTPATRRASSMARRRC
jgi:acetyl-CoA C-acetyltransferase